MDEETIYQDIIATCIAYSIPTEIGEDVYFGFIEFVREEVKDRIKGKDVKPIDVEGLLGIVMNGLVNKYDNEQYDVC